MKKILLIMVAIGCCITLTACGGESIEDSSKTSSITSTISSNSSTTGLDSGSNGELSMDQYITSIQSGIEEMQSGLEASGMKMMVEARNNSLVYRYQYLIDIGDVSLIKPSLEQAMDSLSSTFDATLSAMKLVVPSAESVIVEYLDKDGNLIYSKEYK